MSLLKQKTIITLSKLLVPLFILLIVMVEAKGIFIDFNWALLELYIDRLTFQRLFFIVLLGLAALFPMYFYDEILQRLFRIRVPKKSYYFILYLPMHSLTFSDLGVWPELHSGPIFIRIT